MNITPTRILKSGARPLTRRALAKQRTREKVLEAAKRLFMERGYEGATIRDIAAGAGMSTGAVFASFTDKAELFNEVIIADYDALIARMREASQGVTGARAALSAMFRISYAFHLTQLPLLQAGVSVSWSRPLSAEQRNRQGLQPVLSLIVDILARDVAAGDLPAGLDVRLVGEMIWDAYIANYRRAIYDGWGLEALSARTSAQIDVLLGGRKAA